MRVFLGFFVCAVGVGVIGQAQARETLKQERLEVAAQIQEEVKKQQAFEKDKEYYNSDTYIEQIAKEQLGMIKPNEVLYINRSQ